jgi:P2 family phage contractile tail tube protein
MGLPKKLKNFNVFNDGESYMGQVAEVNLPKLTRKMEEWRAGGMGQPLKIDLGAEAMSMDWTCGGMMRGILSQYAVTKHDGVQLRFAGAYIGEDSDEPDAVEVVIRGRHSEMDPGAAKPGDDTAFKVVTEISYYKLTINGEDVIEIDVINMVEKVNGDDRLAKTRKAIGL